MKLVLERYYGDAVVTKSHLRIYRETGELAFDGEARESAFRDYSEKFRGCMDYCVARGENFRTDIGCSHFGPMTFKLVKIPGRLSCSFGFRGGREVLYSHINVGYADQHLPYLRRKLKDTERAREEVTRLAYEAFVSGERVTCDVVNEQVITLGQEGMADSVRED